MASRLCLALAAAVAAAALTPAAAADTLVLKSGDTFSGTIQKVSPETVEVDTAFAGKLTVKRDTIKTMRSEDRVTIVDPAGAVRRAFLAPVAEGPGWREQDAVAPLPPPPPPPAPPVAAAPPKVYDLNLESYWLPVGPHWKNQFALGVVNTTGNSDSTDLAAELNFTFNDKPWEITFKIGGNYDTTDGKQTAGKFYYDSVYRRTFPEFDKQDRWYAFFEDHDLYDAIKQISYRSTLGFGVGYFFFKDEKGLTLDLRAGPAYVCEKYFSGDSESAMSALAGLRAVYVLNERTSLSEEALYTVSLQDANHYQLTSETALNFKLPEIARGVGLKVAFRDDYENVSAGKRNDTRATLALTLDF
jgi:putative salt-induced outer membrane protein YdiY